MTLGSLKRATIFFFVPDEPLACGGNRRAIGMRLTAAAGFLSLILGGCQGLFFEAPPRDTLSGKDSKTRSAGTRSAAAKIDVSQQILSPADRTVFARCTDKDAKGRSHCVWIHSTDPQAAFRWYNPRLEEILNRPAERRPDLTALLSDPDPGVSANAAIAAGREKLPAACTPLGDAIRAPDLPAPMRCAAAEALGHIPTTAARSELQQLLDQYGQFRKDQPSAREGDSPFFSAKKSGQSPGSRRAPYFGKLHAELLRGLARHVDPGDDLRFRDALHSPSAEVREAALSVWAVGKRGALPIEAADLRTSRDTRVRAAALTALAARRHPRALEYLTAALRDQNLEVRIAAVRGLGVLGTPEALTMLQKLLKDRSMMIRGAAVTALAEAGAASALEAATDDSWRVRAKTAEALADFPTPDGAAVAEQLIVDRSLSVQTATVKALESWPVERSGPLLLKALAESAFATRKAAAEQLAAGWPAAGEFSPDAPATRRAEIIERLRLEFAAEFGAQTAPAVRPAGYQEASRGISPREMQDVAENLERKNYAALRAYGDRLVPALEQWRFRYERPLPEAVYREVLPQCDPIFEVIDRLGATDQRQRRQATAELAHAAAKKPTSRLALDRVRQLLLNQQDPLTWQTVLTGLSDVDQPPVHEIACVGLGHGAAEVRLRACEYLAAHPLPEDAPALLTALKDRQAEVVCAAVRALSASGGAADGRPFRDLLGATSGEVQLAAAEALAQTGDPAGKSSLERLACSPDPLVRARTAQAMGRYPDPAFVPPLIRLLSDKNTVAHAALGSLPKVVGKDVSQPPGQPPPTTTERILRWKRWFEKQP
ncbi:MAG: HEAT repeat domain-containing protein [Pirellulales bacterium]|nr:HEAT repeat domain-containing protein [Pirellulales bacterium]